MKVIGGRGSETRPIPRRVDLQTIDRCADYRKPQIHRSDRVTIVVNDRENNTTVVCVSATSAERCFPIEDSFVSLNSSVYSAASARRKTNPFAELNNLLKEMVMFRAESSYKQVKNCEVVPKNPRRRRAPGGNGFEFASHCKN
jgi:hypothetical protein